MPYRAPCILARIFHELSSRGREVVRSFKARDQAFRRRIRCDTSRRQATERNAEDACEFVTAVGTLVKYAGYSTYRHGWQGIDMKVYATSKNQLRDRRLASISADIMTFIKRESLLNKLRVSANPELLR